MGLTALWDSISFYISSCLLELGRKKRSHDRREENIQHPLSLSPALKDFRASVTRFYIAMMQMPGNDKVNQEHLHGLNSVRNEFHFSEVYRSENYNGSSAK